MVLKDLGTSYRSPCIRYVGKKLGYEIIFHVVVEVLSEVFTILNEVQGLNADVIVDLTNSSSIVIHVPDHISQSMSDMIFESKRIYFLLNSSFFFF